MWQSKKKKGDVTLTIKINARLWFGFWQELHQAFLGSQSEEQASLAAVESCLQTLLEKKKPRLAQTLAHFIQVKSKFRVCICSQSVD